MFYKPLQCNSAQMTSRTETQKFLALISLFKLKTNQKHQQQLFVGPVPESLSYRTPTGSDKDFINRTDINPLLWKNRQLNTTYHNREGGSRHKVLFGVRQINHIRRFHKLHIAEFLFPHLTTCQYQTVYIAVRSVTIYLLIMVFHFYDSPQFSSAYKVN